MTNKIIRRNDHEAHVWRMQDDGLEYVGVRQYGSRREKPYSPPTDEEKLEAAALLRSTSPSSE